MNRFCFLFCSLLAPAAAAVAAAPAPAPAQAALPASARDAAAVVDAFHAALRRGDTRAAARLLAPDALIFESGGAERSKAEYAARHLPADAEFAQAVTTVVTRRRGGSAGSLSWVASEGRATGTFRGKSVDRRTVETMLLRRDGGAWKIAHIHWSSAAITAPAAAAAATSTPLLASSVPTNGAILDRTPSGLELRFAPPARLVEVIVSGPGGDMPMMVTAAGEQPAYSLQLPPLPAGSYTVDWRATAGGRQDRGTFGFTVR